MASFASDHPNIAAWPDPSIGGESLEAVMQTEPVAISRLLDIAVHIARDLDACHAGGVVHGQLTASVIILSRDGGVKILGQSPFPLGSPQDDQLALGRILLTGIETAPDSPEPLRWVIDRLLAEKPEDRYASTRDLYLDLRAIRARLQESPELVSQPTRAEVRKPLRDRRPFLAIPLTLLVFSVFVFYLFNHSPLPKRGQSEIRSFPIWSSDGARILFVKPVAGIDQVFVQSFQSAEPVQLTHASRPSVNPRWSTDEKTIEFHRAGKRWKGPLEPDKQKPE